MFHSSQEKLTTELRGTNAEFYFAMLDNNVIGYLKLNSGQSQTELKDKNSLEIERIYISWEKVGQVHYDKALQVARERHFEYIWLEVWEENPRTIRFYEKMVLLHSTNIFSN